MSVRTELKSSTAIALANLDIQADDNTEIIRKIIDVGIKTGALFQTVIMVSLLHIKDKINKQMNYHESNNDHGRGMFDSPKMLNIVEFLKMLEIN